MAYEPEVLARARNRYAQEVEAFQSEQRMNEQEIHENLPEALELERKLRLTMIEVTASALRHGEDPSQRLGALRIRNQAIQEELRYLLEENGYAPDALDHRYRCEKCSDTGYVGSRMCSCLEKICREEQKKELTSLLHLEASFDDFSLDYYPTAVNPATGQSPRAQMELVYEECVNYAAHFRPECSENLLMNGAPGLGKTFLSACIAQEVVERGYSVVYDTAIHLFSCMEKQKFGGATEEEEKTVSRIMACDLLILDDLGTEMVTAFVTSALYTIINNRLMEHRPTIISSNLSDAQLAQRYSPQIASRLSGEYRYLVFLGQDIRKLKTNTLY